MIEAEESTRPLIVGERTNVIGSREFKKLVAAEQWEEATEIARRQVKSGAHIVDVCLQSTDRDEIKDIPPFYDQLIRKIKAPIMIDTTDARAIELSLTYCQGKSIINSINLEDGEEKFERVCPLARSYGAALIVGCIDEDPLQAQAFTRERKLEIAERSYELLTGKYGIHAENIIFDPLVFPCATGDENYIGGAVETIEGIRLIKQNIPHVRTVLGISNVSFGLPAGAREVVNSVFLYYCTKAGLDLAIVNAERIERFASIPEHERKLAEEPAVQQRARTSARRASASFACFAARRPIGASKAANRKPPSTSFTSRRSRSISAARAAARRRTQQDLPLDQRLPNYILEGSKDGLIDDLNRKREEGVAPLDIINGPLMAGMAEVGRLFNNNELIVAEVLQSAEAMKAAVSHLEQFMEKADTEKRAKVILATVKGDVHDIGKNLVEIILKNNGYDVINLGIKVPPEDLIRAHRRAQARRHRPFRPAREKRAADGHDCRRFARCGNSRSAARGRRRAFRKIHAPENRPAVSDRRLLRERRHDGLASDERIERPESPRCRASGPHVYSRGRYRRSCPAPAGACRGRTFGQGSRRTSRFPRSPISTAKSARFPT